MTIVGSNQVNHPQPLWTTGEGRLLGRDGDVISSPECHIPINRTIPQPIVPTQSDQPIPNQPADPTALSNVHLDQEEPKLTLLPNTTPAFPTRRSPGYPPPRSR
jgi:hypothetical protein